MVNQVSDVGLIQVCASCNCMNLGVKHTWVKHTCDHMHRKQGKYYNNFNQASSIIMPKDARMSLWIIIIIIWQQQQQPNQDTVSPTQRNFAIIMMLHNNHIGEINILNKYHCSTAGQEVDCTVCIVKSTYGTLYKVSIQFARHRVLLCLINLSATL